MECARRFIDTEFYNGTSDDTAELPPAVYEISATNVDKPTIDLDTIHRRISQFQRWD